MPKTQLVYDKARGRIRLAKVVKQTAGRALTVDKGEDVTEWAVECVASHMQYELEKTGKKNSAFVYHVPDCGELQFMPEEQGGADDERD